MVDSDSNPTRAAFDVKKDAQRLDAIEREVARLSGEMKQTATREDVANAQLSIWKMLIPILTALGAAALITGANALIALNVQG